MKSFKVTTILAVLIFCFSRLAFSETSYKSNEVFVDILIFDKYLDAIVVDNSYSADIKNISVDYVKWKTISKDYFNSIDKISSMGEENVIIDNIKFNLKIIFTSEKNKDGVKWTCKIDGQNIFAHFFSPCYSWSKQIHL